MAASMTKNVINRLQLFLNNVEHSIGFILGKRLPPFGPALAVAGQPVSYPIEPHNTEDNPGIWDGLLWAVPKNRRSKERNRTRRRSHYKQVKGIPAQYMTTCDACGHPKKLNFLCGNCLIRIREESKVIQDKLEMQLDEMKDGVVDKEVAVLYEGEQPLKHEDGNNFIEIQKKRPSWFSRELTRNIKH